jgi:hypothetical protein
MDRQAILDKLDEAWNAFKESFAVRADRDADYPGGNGR